MLSTQTYTISDVLQTDYAFAFDWVRLAHVSVAVNGTTVPDSDAEFLASSVPGASTVRFSGATLAGFTNGDIITISKSTPVGFSDRTVDFAADSNVTEESLDDAILHNLSAIQDLNDQITSPGIYLARISAGTQLVANSTDYTSGAYKDNSGYDVALTAAAGWVPTGELGIELASASSLTLQAGTYRITASPRLYNVLSAAGNVGLVLVKTSDNSLIEEARSTADRVGGESVTTFELKTIVVLTEPTTISLRGVCLTSEDIRTAGGYLEVERLDV